MTITVDDVLVLKRWREDVGENKPLELLDRITEQTSHMTSLLGEPVSTVRYVILFDEFIKRLFHANLINMDEFCERKNKIHDCISDEARKLLQAVEP